MKRTESWHGVDIRKEADSGLNLENGRAWPLDAKPVGLILPVKDD